MITLARINSIDYRTNLCKVWVPLLDSAGAAGRTILDATMLLPPGIHSGYKVGDNVFLGFTDNDLGRPVVLGQLYVLKDTADLKSKDQAGTVSCDFLEVEQELELNGEKLTIKISELQNRIATLENTIKTLNSKLTTLTNAVNSVIPTP